MGTNSRTTVELFWRPGCVFCMVLRWSLRRTVFVGTRTLVNPTRQQVLAAVRDHDPDRPRAPDAAGEARHRRRWSRWLPLLAAALLWVLLAAANPTTTYHLAPLLVAAAAPVTARWWTATRVPTAQPAASP